MAEEQHPLAQDAIQSGPGRKGSSKRARRLAKKNKDTMPVVDALDAPRQVRVVEGDLVSPAPDGGILGVLQRPYLLRLLVRREMAKMYSASLLGLLWSYVQPAIRFGVYFVVFGYIMKIHQDVPMFALHLFCGIIVTHYFAETFGKATGSIWQNRQLIRRNPMPRETFPVASMFTAGIHTLPQILLMFGIVAFLGWDVDLYGVASGALGVALIMTFALGMGLLFSALNVYYRDFQNIVHTTTTFMHFLVPMLYPVTRVMAQADKHPVLYQIYMANPVADAVILLQRFFWYPVAKDNIDPGVHNAAQTAALTQPPDMMLRGLITLAVCLLLLWIAQRVFTRLESKFPERL